MCELCKKGDGHCIDCGRLVCFDASGMDDIIRPARITDGGDLVCDRCIEGYEEDKEEDNFFVDYTEEDGLE